MRRREGGKREEGRENRKNIDREREASVLDALQASKQESKQASKQASKQEREREGERERGREGGRERE